MTEETNTKTEETKQKAAPTPAPATSGEKAPPRPRRAARGGAPHGRRERPGERRRGARRGQGGGRERSEFDQKVVSLRRVARVVAGGRRFSFSASVVAGDRKGRVGVGIGKGIDTALAMDKAFRDAKRNMITVPLTDTKSIPHDTEAKYAASVVELKPSHARGIVAGSSVRTVLELAGVTDIIAKIHSRSKNKLNNARATVNALRHLRG
ncbi:MAG: ribosomal protein S5 [Candidatus Paceibacteria bacterium]